MDVAGSDISSTDNPVIVKILRLMPLIEKNRRFATAKMFSCCCGGLGLKSAVICTGRCVGVDQQVTLWFDEQQCPAEVFVLHSNPLADVDAQQRTAGDQPTMTVYR